jgi:hypothetical protein
MRLIDEQAARSHRPHYLRKDLSVEIEERHHNLEGCGLRSLEAGEIIYYKVNVGGEGSGILPRLFDSGLGDIDERDFPTLFCQPDGVASGSSREVERASSVSKVRQDVLGKRPLQEEIGDQPCFGRFAILPVPAPPFIIGNFVIWQSGNCVI